MSFDLVPTNCNFKVTVPGVEPCNNADRVVAIVDTGTEKVTETTRASLKFPTNTFTLSNALWEVFWEWVGNNCRSVLEPDEWQMGCHNEGLFVTNQQCEAIAKLLADALEAKVVIYQGDSELPENTLAVCLLDFLTQCDGFEIW